MEVDTHDKEEQRERYREMLEEFRTILPGVQVLFAFLLTVPFSGRFQDLDSLGRNAFTVAMGLVLLAMIIMLSPAAYHRMAPRQDRATRIRIGHRAAVGGLVLLAASVATATFVVVRFILASTTAGLVIGGGGGLVAALLWFVLPGLTGDRPD